MGDTALTYQNIVVSLAPALHSPEVAPVLALPLPADLCAPRLRLPLQAFLSLGWILALLEGIFAEALPPGSATQRPPCPSPRYKEAACFIVIIWLQSTETITNVT